MESAFQVIGFLRALRAYEKRHLRFLTTAEDHDLICEIGFHQARGAPLGMKQLMLLDVGSAATLQRRLRRMRHLGLLRCDRSARDRRAIEVTLSPRLLHLYARYGSAVPGLLSAGDQRVVYGGGVHPERIENRLPREAAHVVDAERVR